MKSDPDLYLVQCEPNPQALARNYKMIEKSKGFTTIRERKKKKIRQGQDYCTMQPDNVAARRRYFDPSSKQVSAQANLIEKIWF
jgi:hypothetical protein